MTLSRVEASRYYVPNIQDKMRSWSDDGAVSASAHSGYKKDRMRKTVAVSLRKLLNERMPT